MENFAHKCTKATLMINKTQQPSPTEETICVSLYPEAPERRMRGLMAAKGVRLFVSTVIPDVELALVHRMLVISYRGFGHMHRSRPDVPDCDLQELVTIGFVNHDPEGIDLQFWTIPFAADLLSAFDLEIKTWWASLVDARRADISARFDDEPRIDWQMSPPPECADVHRKPKKGVSKNRKKSSKNKKMSLGEWLLWVGMAKAAGWAAAAGDVRRCAYFAQVYPLLHEMRRMCRAAGLRCEVAVRISYPDGREPFAVSFGTEEFPELATVSARAKAAWRGQIRPIANRVLRRCFRAGVECRVEFEALGKVGTSGGFDDEALVRIERRLRNSLDRRLGRKKESSAP
jgi:hypothetical protein